MRFWNDAVSAAVAAAAADPVDAGTFSGTLRRLDLGSIRFVEVLGGASSVHRLPSFTRPSYFVLSLMLAGEIVCRAGGTETRVKPGDFWLFSPAAPADMVLAEPASLLAICVRRDHITRYIARPDALSAVAVTGQSGPGALASRYLRDFWNRAEHELTPSLASRFAETGLQMMASAYASMPEARPERSALVTHHRLRIRAYIEEHLRDPDLTPQSIAEGLHITPSYLHRMFSNGAESVARYVMRRRLEECHRALSDPMQAATSITTIAFEHGFNSLPHFCRVFRAQYGITPREAQIRAQI
jgi:AraC-like DNA-binding protein